MAEEFPTIRPYMFTNLIGLGRFSDNDVKNLLLGLTNIEISIGGLDKEGYAEMFGVDRFEKVFDNLFRLAGIRNNFNIECELSLHIRTTNSEKIWNHERLAQLRDIGFVCRDVATIFSDFGGVVQQEHLPQGALIQKTDLSAETRSCVIPSAYLGVAPDGKAAGCSCFDGRGATTIGDANTETLSEIWKGKKAASFRNSFQDGKVLEVCRTCAFYRPAKEIFSNPGLAKFDYIKDNFWHKLN